MYTRNQKMNSTVYFKGLNPIMKNRNVGMNIKKKLVLKIICGEYSNMVVNSGKYTKMVKNE